MAISFYGKMHFSFAQPWEVVENGVGGLVEAVGMV